MITTRMSITTMMTMMTDIIILAQGLDRTHIIHTIQIQGQDRIQKSN
jgi:hypothetical protein